MGSMRVVSQRAGYAVAAFTMALAIVLPAIVSAAQVTSRSIQLSNASVASSNVTYGVNFTPVVSAGAFVVDFCANSPLIGQECEAPTGLNSAGAATATSGFTIDSSSANRVVVAGSMSTSPVSVDISGINNPTVAGTIYARIVTYDTALNAAASTPQAPGANAKDDGAVALSITPTIGISGDVLESITFCVSGGNQSEANPIEADCDGTLVAPTLKLGEKTGDIVALTPGVISEGTIFTQISTNANSGAVVRLKSNATNCGGLLRAGAPGGTCDILPALDQGITSGTTDARFGVKTATATGSTGVGVVPSGTLVPASGSLYSNSDYALNYVEGNATGITSTFGDPFLDTAGKPANNQNMALTFGVKVNNDTPAGAYSADLSMIAVGKF